MEISRRDFSLTAIASVAAPLAVPSTSACSQSRGRADPGGGSNYHSTLVNGLTPRRIAWNGREWLCDAGSTWHPGMDYALRLTPAKARFEVRDTEFDRSEADPPRKRRAELHCPEARLPNDVPLWGAMSFIHHSWDDPAGMSALEGGVHGQMHIGSSFGGSPAMAFRRDKNGNFRITTRGELEPKNTTRFDFPLPFNAVHDLVYSVVLSPNNGSLLVWLDGQQVVNLRGASIGSHYAECYWNIGCYYGGGVTCPVIAEFANHVYPGPASLAGRISAPPRWPAA